MITCKDCSKKFRIKLINGDETSCPYCGYDISLREIDQVRWFMDGAKFLSQLVVFFIGMNAGLLYPQGRLIVRGGWAVASVIVIHHLMLWIAGKMYDKFSNKSE